MRSLDGALFYFLLAAWLGWMLGARRGRWKVEAAAAGVGMMVGAMLLPQSPWRVVALFGAAAFLAGAAREAGRG